MRREERGESILGGAARAFARTGFAATSMEDIAAEAGITKLIVYRHFAGKRELYEAVLARVSERLVAAFHASKAERASGIGLAALLRTARQDEAAFLLLFRHAGREPEFAAYADEYLARVTRAAETWLAYALVDRVLRRWMATVSVRWAVEAVITWLEVGAADRDEEFLVRAGRGLRSMTEAVAR
jgi:AcrR family transcriptional regulator